MKAKTYLIINWYQKSKTADHRPYVILAYERGVHRKFTILLRRLRRTGCREETRYNMPLLEVVGMTSTGKNFTVATAFMCNEQTTAYRWVRQQIKHLYVTSAMLTGRHIDQNVLAKLSEMVKDEEVVRRIRTSQVLHFGIKTMNRTKSEHSVLQLWLSTYHATKGRRKTNSTKRDKSYWEYVSIAHRKIGKGSGLGLGSGPCPHGRGRPPRSGRDRGRGRNSGRVVANFLFGDENQWPEIRRRISYDLHHHMNMHVQLFESLERVYELIKKRNWEEGLAPYEHWMDTPDHLYVIANTFNFCVVLIARLGSITILPFYSNIDCTAGTLFIGFISEQEHFIQLQLRDGCPLPPMQVQ
ncbi:hypothetical protein M9H77_27443 [Catharanthus roseus]|uniref:Uncharacterized protein n=1 Tax=Catharanthus roseus TaxID=4058 RepID=A0ACC0AE62_CATRO|nr:hypothetical protein M9H77_27443 [Catharanthus roseus]